MVKADVEFSFDQAVRTLGVTPARLERLIEEHKIESVRDEAGRLLVPRHAILAYLAEVSAVPLKQRKG
jgi:hypothetical protein